MSGKRHAGKYTPEYRALDTCLVPKSKLKTKNKDVYLFTQFSKEAALNILIAEHQQNDESL